ncbi:cytochrome c oxidase accessory protein CcoG [Lautropia dentalis]|uniref:cytochrome c oxidase accessory protein CcoG n=1 Tax=Lautropia dentalis TaxID=2490857 RepID=UPI001EF03FC4|nr:cytochrome c oxidase accessory protein CcoG [Lautropia dentalis]
MEERVIQVHRPAKDKPKGSAGKTAAARAAAEQKTGSLFSSYAARVKIQPRSVRGRYDNLRIAALVITQLVFFGLPWLMWNGRQAVLFDLDARKFHLFGAVLWPQDFVYLAGLLVFCALTLFFVTAVAGRVWCGYSCPQTVYTEIFLWIEAKLEGDGPRRRKLDDAPWSWHKLRVRGTKHVLWVLFALFTGFTLIGYFAPIRDLPMQIIHLELGPWQWFWFLFYAFALWGNAGFLREQVCTHMCPYARFQGAMFDKDTMIVTYDKERGDPRGSRSKKADPAALGLGSCIDCGLCVEVCPTGIDIRDGLQYQCISCAACIDVCNGVMDKMGYARGLIRYATENALTNHLDSKATAKRILRPRVLIYGLILLVLAGALVGSLVSRNTLRVDIIRDRGALSGIAENGDIENTYTLNLMNTSERPLVLDLGVTGMPELRIDGQTRIEVPATSNRMVPLAIHLPPTTTERPGSHNIEITVTPVPQEGEEDTGAKPRREGTVYMVPR